MARRICLCGASLIGGVGAEDVEYPQRAMQFGPLRLQRDLTMIADKCAAHGLVVKYQAEERWADLHQLSDLSSKDASHEWLWATHPHKTRKCRRLVRRRYLFRCPSWLCCALLVVMRPCGGLGLLLALFGCGVSGARASLGSQCPLLQRQK